MVSRFLKNTSAAVPVEYCLIAGLISIVIIVSCTQIASKINAKFYGPLLNGFN